MQCMSVDLPEPDGPMIAVNRPRGEVDAHAVERAHLGLALAVDLGQVDRARRDLAHRLRGRAGLRRRGHGLRLGHRRSPLSAGGLVTRSFSDRTPRRQGISSLPLLGRIPRRGRDVRYSSSRPGVCGTAATGPQTRSSASSGGGGGVPPKAGQSARWSHQSQSLLG